MGSSETVALVEPDLASGRLPFDTGGRVVVEQELTLAGDSAGEFEWCRADINEINTAG